METDIGMVGAPLALHAEFSGIVDKLPALLDRLMGMAPIDPAKLQCSVPLHGVYLFSECAKHLYVGRSDNMRTRVRNHCSGNERQAAFAFQLAREAHRADAHL